MGPMNRLQAVRGLLWVWVWVCIVLVLLWSWWALPASSYRYEFEQGSGALDSERWNADFFFTASVLFQLLAPITLAFALDSPLRHWRRTMHLVLVALLFVWAIVTMAFWADYYAHANDATASNARNPANDPRWCNLYYALPNSGCPQTSPTTGLIASMLSVSDVFLWKFWFLVVWHLFLILDVFFVLAGLRPAVLDFEREGQEPEGDEEAPLPEDPKTPLLKVPKRASRTTVTVLPAGRALGLMPGRK